jgi:hypothetical protein
LYNNTCAYPALKASSPARVSETQWLPSHTSTYPSDSVPAQYGDSNKNKRRGLSISDSISSSNSNISSSFSHVNSSQKSTRREKHSGTSSRHNLSYSNRSTERRHREKGAHHSGGSHTANVGTSTSTILPEASYVTRAAVVEYCRYCVESSL